MRFRRQTQRQRRRQGSGIAALQQGACGAEERDSCKSWCFEDAQKGYLGGVRKFMGAAAAAAVLSASSVGGVSAALAAEALPIEQEQLLSDFNVEFVVRGGQHGRLAYFSFDNYNWRKLKVLTIKPRRFRSLNAIPAPPPFPENEPQGRKVDHKVIVELVVLGQTIGFIGALVGGFSARDRKRQVEDLNERLLAVNKQLRQQARSTMSGGYERDSIDVATKPSSNTPEHASPDDADQRNEVIEILRAGKAALKEENAQDAVRFFKLSLERAREHADVLDNVKKVERKAYRGLGGAYLILHDYDKALEYMKLVLALSEEMGESKGVGDALGVIADIYTDMGDLEKAGEWYDKYLDAMMDEMAESEQSEKPVSVY